MKKTLALLLMLSLSVAQITATMGAPAEIIKGGQLTVKIFVQNNGSETEIVVRQAVGYQPIYPAPVGVQIPGYITPQYYYWNATIQEGETLALEFAEIVEDAGEYQIPPATVFFEEGSVKTNSPVVFIVCDGNGLCDAGENIMNCPVDCSSGAADGFCDEVADGICDMDCDGLKDAADPDCSCGDGICESGEDCVVDCGKISRATPDFSGLQSTIMGIIIVAVIVGLIIVGGVFLYLKTKKKGKGSGKA